MEHETQVDEFMRIFSDRFFESKARLEQKRKVRVALERFARFKEEQMRILIEKRLEGMATKVYHPDRLFNENALIGARILADDVLSELNTGDYDY